MSIGPLPVSKSKLYFPQLDSIRGISFIAIFLFHAVRIPGHSFFGSDFLHYFYKNLDLGVEVFFVLSAFLLTWLGLNEYKKRNNFSLSNYFKRRTLRIWPLYFFILILAFLIFPQVAKYFHFEMSLPNVWYYIFFISNFYTIDHIFFLRFLWTISVEEQFYFLWGICLRFFYKKLFYIAIFLIISSISFSVYTAYNHLSSYFNSITYLFDFACGGLAALLILRKSKCTEWLRNLTSTATVIFYSYLIFHFIIFYFLNKITTGFTNDMVALMSRYLIIIYIAILIAEQMINKSRTKILEKSKFLTFTGKISYGLYCYHGITITLINLLLSRFHFNNLIMVIIYFTINYLIATISYFYLETPFLKLKTKLRRV